MRSASWLRGFVRRWPPDQTCPYSSAPFPFVGGIILLVFMFLEGQPNANDYGSNPKAVAAA